MLITRPDSAHTHSVAYSARRQIVGAQMDFGRAAPPASEEEQALMTKLSREPSHVDEIVRNTGLAAAKVSATLALLELKGLVRDVGGMQYVRVREPAADYEPASRPLESETTR